MQLENINYYKKQLLEDGYLDINIKSLYPDLFDKLNQNINQQILIDELCVLETDVNLDGIYTEEMVKEIYSDFESIIQSETINLYHNDNTQTKLILKLELDKRKNTFSTLTEIRNRFQKITKSQNQQWLASTTLNDNTNELFSEFTQRLVNDFYNIETKNTHNRITCFLKGDLIVEHEDAVDSNFLCVILLYLNTEYKDGFGGELVLNHTHKVPAEFGRLALLDFTNNNITHRVDEVKEDYMRFALSNFISK